MTDLSFLRLRQDLLARTRLQMVQYVSELSSCRNTEYTIVVPFVNDQQWSITDE